MSMDMKEQYDKIYRYCYFRLHHRETAEDITQETFLRFFERYHCSTTEQTLRCLYTIARNLCIDEYRRRPAAPLEESLALQAGTGFEEDAILTGLAVRSALSGLDAAEQELLLLRYVNDVSPSAIGKILGISRFAVYRRLLAATGKLKDMLGKENF